jgi:hypothetical protein
MEKHAKFFDKSLGRSYIKQELLRSLPPLEDRISKEVKAAGEAYFDKKYKKQVKKLNLNFGSDYKSKNEKEASSRKTKVQWVFDSIDLAANSNDNTMETINQGTVEDKP